MKTHANIISISDRQAIESNLQFNGGDNWLWRNKPIKPCNPDKLRLTINGVRKRFFINHVLDILDANNDEVPNEHFLSDIDIQHYLKTLSKAVVVNMDQLKHIYGGHPNAMARYMVNNTLNEALTVFIRQVMDIKIQKDKDAHAKKCKHVKNGNNDLPMHASG